MNSVEMVIAHEEKLRMLEDEIGPLLSVLAVVTVHLLLVLAAVSSRDKRCPAICYSARGTGGKALSCWCQWMRNCLSIQVRWSGRKLWRRIKVHGKGAGMGKLGSERRWVQKQQQIIYLNPTTAPNPCK